MAISYQRKLGDTGVVVDNSTGNVGIGTNDPSQILDISGYARATSGFVGNTTARLFGDNTSTEYLAVNTNGTVQITAYGAGTLVTDAGGNISVNTSTYLTSYTEADTLDTVADRGSTTNQNLTAGGFTTTGTVDTTTLDVGGYRYNNPAQGKWYQVGTYQHISPTTYYKYTKVAKLNSNTIIGALEYVCKKDSNYPGAVRGTVHVATYNGSSMSVQHDQHGGDGDISPEVYIDDNRDIWLRMVNSAWNSHLRFRWIDIDGGITTYDGSTQQNSTVANSALVAPGQSVRFTWGDVTALTVYNSVSKAYNLNVETDITVGDQIIHRGDTDTYMQFHANDQWRVVTAGSERLEVGANVKISNAYTLPNADGSAGQVLQTNGSGVVSFGTVSGGGGTADTVKTEESTSTANHFLTFVDSNNTTATGETIYTTAGITVNPDADSIFATGNIVSYASSDRRLKDNLTPIANATEKISKLSGYEFDWNDKQLDFEGHDVGVVAQEVEEVLPEVVTTRKDGYKAVKYEKIVALLIEGMKEQQAEIDLLKEEVKKLKG